MPKTRFVAGVYSEHFEQLTSMAKELDYRSRNHLVEEFLGIATKLGKEGLGRLKGRALLKGKTLGDFASELLLQAANDE